ncbi:hypothetical protein GCM10007854_19410 [Algimonas porphyrae]|uniref:Uncharacterized protein n=1 Tax=Algimonas porphyrae TaxID=1128113 RepID=A0ABQ5V0K4_9PROT|nr:hypothetical protein GCM10007854_19410 [Algimonas porphyrae]
MIMGVLSLWLSRGSPSPAEAYFYDSYYVVFNGLHLLPFLIPAAICMIVYRIATRFAQFQNLVKLIYIQLGLYLIGVIFTLVPYFLIISLLDADTGAMASATTMNMIAAVGGWMVLLSLLMLPIIVWMGRQRQS